jgi:hypothetical protein
VVAGIFLSNVKGVSSFTVSDSLFPKQPEKPVMKTKIERKNAILILMSPLPTLAWDGFLTSIQRMGKKLKNE